MPQTSIRQRPPSRTRPRERSNRTPPPRLREVSLDDRYLHERGRIFLSGVQALVRVPLDQHRADRRRGLHTATLVSGYQGSPLGGLDKELANHAELCAEHHLVHRPALNEELGATAAWGSQLAAGLPGARYDGVVGVWYGKAPGLDRAADALRHGNYAGVAAAGGGLALVGDDPACKSSTLPSASEATLASMHLPVFFPGSVQEVLDLGLHAIACSRASGLWSALKVVTSVADATASAEVAPDRVKPVEPELARRYRHQPNAKFLPPHSPELERSLLGPRTELALAYARANDVNRIEGAGGDAWLGVVAAGSGYRHLRQALADLGLSERELERAGVRILRLGMIWPLEPEVVRSFAAGLEEILVVEEKGPFLESQLKEVLYGSTATPRIVGKRDESGAPLLRAELDLDADRIARAVAARLRQRVTLESVEARMRRLDAGTPGPRTLQMAGDGGPKRTPSFCSGCPHSASTAAPEGELVGAGIGCHTMVLLSPEGRGELTGVTQMGGEGAQWIGIEPFTDVTHFTQNIGDGTFFHSGSLAIRAAVAAGANVTYKLLANGTVAMTGGQDVEGGMDVPEMTRLLELEGVRRIVVTTEEPRRYRRAKLAACAEIRPRRDLDAVQRELAAVEGVTVLIHDGACAAELRRARKRGLAPQPADRVVINERVCEGCGDCGRKSGCMSVQPVETQLGRKTRIHQSSCNLDRSCVDGDCPAFLTVVPAASDGPRAVPTPPADLPEPRLPHTAETSIRIAGIGGTGVVTISQLLGMAALLDGLHVAGLDQTGLSQKGGPVTSDLRIAREPIAGTGRASAAGVDVLLGLDLLGAASPDNLAVCDPTRTAAVISTSAVPTQTMVVDTRERFPALAAQLDPIDRVTRAQAGLTLDSQALSEQLFGDHMQANAIVLGAALQRGLLPITLAALQRAIELNGAAVERNRAALAWGRACVADPDAVEAATWPPEPAAPTIEPWAVELAESAAGGRAEMERLLEFRIADLAGFGGKGLAREYAAAVASVRAAEQERAPGHTGIAESFARGLHRLTAYKDEYEVARLHLDTAERARIEAEMGDLDSTSYHLHPPLLRALGMRRKLRLGGWFRPGLRALRAGRRLRGTPLDPFGHTAMRRTERALAGEYREGLERALASLSPATHADCVELCEAAELVRGYEQIKLDGIERFRERTAELLADEGRSAAASPSREYRPARRSG
jgi:indolepyruvate ferredoxin oxidoreductase